MQLIPKRARAARTAAGLSQARAAEALGVSPQAVLNVEMGRSDPHASLVGRMAHVYGVPIGVLYGEGPEPDQIRHTKGALRSVNGGPAPRRMPTPQPRHEEPNTVSDTVNVAIIGVGNCASSLVQGVNYYRDASPDEFVPGLMHTVLGGYHVRDVRFTAAFDIDSRKVGRDLSEAIFAEPNNTFRFSDPPKTGVTVQRGMTHDGLGKYLSEVITKAPGPTADIVGILKDTDTHVVVSYLPVGSEQATKWYVEQILQAGCAFVNCVPVFIGREAYWQARFRERGLPIIGDDIKSQVGATITHRMLARLMRERGIRLEHTSQLNFGGNTDFLNMLERERLASKKISKTNAVTSIVDQELDPRDIHIGPSDYVPWLLDRKWAHIRLEGRGFGDVPMSIEMKLEVWDSPNSAGIVIDAVRCAKLALDRGVSGTLEGPSSYFMKSPPVQHPDDQCRDLTEAFIRGEGMETAGLAPSGGVPAAG